MKVSVIIPCYNLGAYIKDAVESVEAQTLQDFEIIIVDDGSTDRHTIKALESLAQDKVQVFRIKNRKLPGARNYGINKAQGKYIVCLDADDMLAPRYLEKSVAVLDKDKAKKFAFVTTWLREFGERTNVWETSNFDVAKILITNVVHAGSMFRKEAWSQVNGYTEIMTEGYEDWEFWLSIIEKGYSWEVIPETLFYYRIRKNSMLASSRTVHMDIYQKIYDLHPKLFNTYAKELAIQNAKELQELHDVIHQKNDVLTEYQEYKAEVINLRTQVFQYRDELHTIKNSRVIGRIIKFRKFIGKTIPRLKRLPVRVARKVSSLVSRILPSVIKRKIKTAWSLMNNKQITYHMVSNKFWELKLPLMSVVIPYYNRADTIDETLESLLTQTFQNIEIIIVDDGSTDPESAQKLKNLKAAGLNAEFIYQENRGVAAARNTGISKAKGKYVICLDSDDILEPTFIEKSVIVLETDPDSSLITTHQQMFGVVNELYKNTQYHPLHLDKDNRIITAAAFRREAWQVAGGYKSTIGYEDWEFWLNLSEHGHWARLIPEPLFRYRTSMQSRYVEDKDLHWSNIKKIQELHPNYRKIVKKLVTQRRRVRKLIDPATAFINIDKPNSYQSNKNDTQNVLIAIPWMTFGGAETLIVNFCNEVKDEYNLSFITGLQSEHEWEYKFREITNNIYHLASLFDDAKLCMEFISNYIKTRNIHILHIVHTSFMFDMLAEIKRRHPSLKVVTTVFNDRAHFQDSVKTNKYIDAYTTDNMSVADHYRKDLGESKQVTVIPNGINSHDNFNPIMYDRIKEREVLGIEPSDIAIFFIGRLSEEKNPDVFLEVAKNTVAVDSANRIKFFVIGDGGMKPSVEKMVADINSQNVIYLGYQSEIARYLSAADIFVLPSAIEGFPLSILEAMAMRVVVIASDVGAVSEVIDSGKDGFVVSPGSAKEITETILTLADKADLLRDIKAQARKKIDKKYSNKILGDNYKKLYRGLLK